MANGGPTVLFSPSPSFVPTLSGLVPALRRDTSLRHALMSFRKQLCFFASFLLVPFFCRLSLDHCGRCNDFDSVVAPKRLKEKTS